MNFFFLFFFLGGGGGGNAEFRKFESTLQIKVLFLSSALCITLCLFPLSLGKGEMNRGG